MRFLPRVNVMYRGEFHRTDEAFEIDAADAKELAFVGCVEADAESSTQVDTQVDTQVEPKPKAASRKKAAAKS